jgi:hypothetical protein
MTSGFTKLYNQIITSSIWSEDDKVRIMWITLLASADPKGYVSGSIPGMAAIARMSLPDAKRSIKTLCSPDPYSRSKENEGRRLEEVDGGWVILNYPKYRAKRDPEERRLQNREAKRRQREREKNARSQQNVSQCQPTSAQDRSQKTDTTPYSPPQGTGVELFDRFWSEYPRKVGKKKCRHIWNRLKPSAELAEKIITAVKAYKRTDQWQKNNGQFIPHPATWLNQERWNDEISASPEPKRGDPDWLPSEAEAEQIMRDSGMV